MGLKVGEIYSFCMLMGLSQGKGAPRGAGGRGEGQTEASRVKRLGLPGGASVRVHSRKGKRVFPVGTCLLRDVSGIEAQSEDGKGKLEA